MRLDTVHLPVPVCSQCGECGVPRHGVCVCACACACMSLCVWVPSLTCCSARLITTARSSGDRPGALVWRRRPVKSGKGWSAHEACTMPISRCGGRARGGQRQGAWRIPVRQVRGETWKAQGQGGHHPPAASRLLCVALRTKLLLPPPARATPAPPGPLCSPGPAALPAPRPPAATGPWSPGA